jgi:hypothetical protein
MGNTYETDGIDKRNEIALALQASVAMKSLGNLIACRSWLQARLALREVKMRVDDLSKTVTQGSAPASKEPA